MGGKAVAACTYAPPSRHNPKRAALQGLNESYLKELMTMDVDGNGEIDRCAVPPPMHSAHCVPGVSRASERLVFTNRAHFVICAFMTDPIGKIKVTFLKNVDIAFANPSWLDWSSRLY
jgi:hypothetical protein